jgi:tight adherence protein B
VACLLLTGLGLSALLVEREMRRRKVLQGRLAKATTHELRSRKVALRSLLRTDETRHRLSFADHLAHLPGFDVRRRADYPGYWWAVVPAALLVGYQLAVMARGLLGQTGWLAWPVVALVVMRYSIAWARARRDAKLLLQFPEALGMLVRSVRAGLPLTDALRVLARECPLPTSAQFQIVVSDLAIGMPVGEALTLLSLRTALAEYHFFATALAVQAQTGGRLSETLDSLGETIRKRIAAKDRAIALAAEARTSALILAALPIVAGGAVAAVNWPYMAVMFTDPHGQHLLGIATGSLGTGLLAMHVVIKRSVS